ncbi:hypothetical protein NMG60_11030255 [Bertholletia excelsa]
MAAAPVKSQPLHNFSLPFLKWGHKNQVNGNHRYRRPSDAVVRESAPPSVEDCRSSLPEQDCNGGSGGADGKRNESEAESRKPAVGSRSETARTGLEIEGEGIVGEGQKQKACDEADAEESPAKPWNLRPRKATAKAAVVEIGGFLKDAESQENAPTEPATENLTKSMRLRGFAEGHGSERKEKRKFWITLSREEIEEDIYSMTGGKAARRPRKRPKTVQKQVDNVFPGLYLVGLTADSYRIYETLLNDVLSLSL